MRKNPDKETREKFSHWIDMGGEKKSPIANIYNYGEKSEANARLIAAAPDLLKVAKSALMFEQTKERPTKDIFDWWTEVIDKAQNP